MLDKLTALLESKRTTIAALVGALLLLLADGQTAAALTNDMGVPADISLKVVALAKFVTTLLAAAGISLAPHRKPADAGE